jgi:MFS family permease
MQTVALHWHVYLLTRSPLALGALGLTRVLPIILFSLWGGVAADRLDRRRVMFATQATMLAGAAALAILTFTGHEGLAVLYPGGAARRVSAAGESAWIDGTPRRHVIAIHSCFSRLRSDHSLAGHGGLVNDPCNTAPAWPTSSSS